MEPTTRSRLTPLESLIMNCLWDRSPATVREVQKALEPVKPMAYNTVLTMMRILRDKGFLSSEREGRSDAYCPTVRRKEVAQHSLRDLMDRLFAGSASALVSSVLDFDELNADEIKAIRTEVDRRLGNEP
jgi:predicted transcriptional regulator